MLPPLKPIAMKERISMIFIERGEIDVLDGSFVVIDKNGVRTHIPVGSLACIMLEPGTRVSHRAATLAARVGALLVWLIKIRASVYIGNLSTRLRDFIWEQVEQGLEDGNAVMAWNTNTASDYDFKTSAPTDMNRWNWTDSSSFPSIRLRPNRMKRRSNNLENRSTTQGQYGLPETPHSWYFSSAQ